MKKQILVLGVFYTAAILVTFLYSTLIESAVLHSLNAENARQSIDNFLGLIYTTKAINLLNNVVVGFWLLWVGEYKEKYIWMVFGFAGGLMVAVIYLMILVFEKAEGLMQARGELEK